MEEEAHKNNGKWVLACVNVDEAEPELPHKLNWNVGLPVILSETVDMAKKFHLILLMVKKFLSLERDIKRLRYNYMEIFIGHIHQRIIIRK